jgi:hypothetical protein
VSRSLPVSRVLLGVGLLVLALAPSPSARACEKGKCSAAGPASSNEPEVGVLSIPSPPVPIGDLTTPRPAFTPSVPDQETRSAEARNQVRLASATKPAPSAAARSRDSQKSKRVTPAVAWHPTPPAPAPSGRAREPGFSDRLAPRPHRMPAPEIL